jgi:DNA polymerase-3 subunit delta'
VTVLQRAIEQGRIPPGFLFSGPDAVGKKLLASFWARAINCTGSNSADWCGRCRSCVLAGTGNHPDICEVQPDGQFIKIEQVRNLSRQAVYQPFQGKCKVFILDDADRLHPTAANALLKILEEPPPTSKFVLVTSKPHALLPTIRSRCQVLQFSPIPAPVIEKILATRCGISHLEAATRARLADGSVGKAIQLNIQRDQEMAQAASEFLDLAWRNAPLAEASDLTAKFCKEREDMEDWLRHLFGALRENMLQRIAGGDIQAGERFWTLPQLESLSQAASEVRHGLEHNINRSLAVESLYLLFRKVARD